jgi:ferredoxin
MRVSIDTARCQGHGRCAIIAPEVFDVDDLGKGKVLIDPCPEEFHAAAEEAEFSCPETAITVSSLPTALVSKPMKNKDIQNVCGFLPAASILRVWCWPA